MILGLDLAKRTGWAYLDDEGKPVKVGAIEYPFKSALPWEEHYIALYHFQNELDTLYTDLPFDLVAVEYAAFQSGHANEMFFGWLTLLKMYCGIREIPLQKYYTGQIKRECGLAKVDRKKWAEAANKQFGLSLLPHQDDEVIAIYAARLAHEERMRLN